MAMILPRSLKEAMIEHLRMQHPNEGCGLLAGEDERATELFPIRNIEEEIPERRYLMDPREQLKAFREIDARGLKLVAIYHSHPATEAYPSPADVGLAIWKDDKEEIELYPGVAYLIVSFQDWDNPVVRAFRIQAGGKIEEEEVKETLQT